MRFRRRHLLAAAAACAVVLLPGCAAGEEPETGPGGKYRFILSNDGGSLAGPVLEAPIGVEGLVKLAIEPLRDTQINTLFWQLGTDPYLGSPSHRLSDHYSHRTEVGAIWGTENPSFHSAGLWRIRENAKRLMEAGTDPAAVVVEHGRRAGLEVFLCMRVNDVHDSRLEGGVKDPLMSPVKRRHPDWLLGEEGSRRTAYNFALPQVREYKLALAREAIENYDLDGLDWDFCRHPFLFPQGTEAEGAPLLTGLLAEIRRALDEKGKRAGRRLALSVRVPGSLDEALSQGMDVRSWLSKGLLDLLIVGYQPGNKHRLPVEEYVEAARGTGTQVVAQGLGLFQQPRPLSAKLIWNEKDYYTAEMCRAVAAAHYRAGAQGIFVFNNHYLQVVRDRQYDRLPWKELGDPPRHRPQGQALPGGSEDLGSRPAAAGFGQAGGRGGNLPGRGGRPGSGRRGGCPEIGDAPSSGGPPDPSGPVGDHPERPTRRGSPHPARLLQRDLARIRNRSSPTQAGVEPDRRRGPGPQSGGHQSAWA